MADVTIGARLQLDANDGIKSLKDLKAQIKEAQGDLIAMSNEFGETSEQARMAAKRVAELQDSLGDAKNLVEAFNPDKKFIALGQALNGVLGGFTALTGAMGLLGVESEEVQKQLLKVQSALALSQGLNQIGDSINSFKTLGKTIVDTLGKSGAIGLAIAGVTALGVAIWQTVSRNKELEAAQKEYNKALIDARVEVAKVQDAFRQARLGIISKDEALKQYNSTIGQTVGEAKTLNEAEQLTAKNAGNYIKVQGLKAKANFLLAESAKISGEAELARLELENNPALAAASFGGFEGKIKEAEAKAAQLQNVVAGIETQIKTLSTGFAAPTGSGGGKATTQAGIQKEKEIQELDMLGKFEAEQARLKIEEERRLKDIRIGLNEELKVSDANLVVSRIQGIQEQNNALAQQLAYEEYIAESRAKLPYAIGNALSALSDLVGKQTAAGKVLAIAEATINTYLAASNILKNTARNPATGAIPGFAIAQMIATVAAGLVTVRNIAKTPVPNTGTGGGVPNIGSAQAPLQPQVQTPISTRTRLEQDQLNQIGNATVRAFVVESDVTNNQERIRRLNRAARI